MGPLKRGVELVARPSGATIVPAYIEGSYQLWPPHRMFPRAGKVRVFFDAPIRASIWDAKGQNGGAASLPQGEGAEPNVSSPPVPPKGAEEKSCTDLVTRLEASYRSMEARARRVRRAGAAGWRLHVSRATFSRREPPGCSGPWRAER